MLATWIFGSGLLGLTLIGKVQRKRLLPVLCACVLAVMIVGSTSCGGKGSSPITTSSGTASSYAVTINGSSGSVQLSTTITVTVQ